MPRHGGFSGLDSGDPEIHREVRYGLTSGSGGDLGAQGEAYYEQMGDGGGGGGGRDGGRGGGRGGAGAFTRAQRPGSAFTPSSARATSATRAAAARPARPTSGRS